ncbi:MAG: prepilin peptidase [Promethearchaeota archaeon]
MLNLIMYSTNLIFMTSVLTYCLILDIKNRKIPNQSVKVFFIIAVVLFFTEAFVFLEEIYLFFFIKFIFVFFATFLSFILFSLKIIGGGDGKIIILIFFISPISCLNSLYLFSFFLFLILSYFILIIINLCLNCFTVNRFSFKFFFQNLPDATIFRKFYLLSCFRFITISKLCKYKKNKYMIISLDIIFNPKSCLFQIFTQFKPPVILSCFLSYILLLLLRF